MFFLNGHDESLQFDDQYSFHIDDRFVFAGSSLPFAATDIGATTAAMISGNASLSLRGASAKATAHIHDPNEARPEGLTLVFDQVVEDMVLITTAPTNVDCVYGSFKCDSSSAEMVMDVNCLIIGDAAITDGEHGKLTCHRCALILTSSGSDGQLKKRIGVLSLPKDLQVFEATVVSSFDLV